MGNSLTTGIIKRTQSGKDVNKSSFKPYSKNYKKQGKVDLTVKGTMLHGISFKKIKNGIMLYFAQSAERKKAQGNSRIRHFFGIDKDQKTKIIKQLIKKILRCK